MYGDKFLKGNIRRISMLIPLCHSLLNRHKPREKKDERSYQVIK